MNNNNNNNNNRRWNLLKEFCSFNNIKLRKEIGEAMRDGSKKTICLLLIGKIEVTVVGNTTEEVMEKASIEMMDKIKMLINKDENENQHPIRNKNDSYLGYNPVSVLNEYCHKKNSFPKYEQLNCEGPQHDPLFTIKVTYPIRYPLNQVTMQDYSSIASARTKNEAKRKAAHLALTKIKKLNQEPKPCPPPIPIKYLNSNA
ncbi:uncharacterized protein LOC122850421 [Aphidius gifuensis]|nr:uncharacterized protein LOC122850421 [Aphidius gifuensis]